MPKTIQIEGTVILQDGFIMDYGDVVDKNGESLLGDKLLDLFEGKRVHVVVTQIDDPKDN